MNKRTIWELAHMLGLPEWDDIREHNFEVLLAAGLDAERELEEDADDPDDLSDGELVDASLDAQQRAETELLRGYLDAVERAAESALEFHRLGLEPEDYCEGTGRPYSYRIRPADTWRAAATMIAMTVQGIGFPDGPEHSDERPRDYVLARLGAIGSVREVYGSDPRSSFDCTLEDAARRL